MARHRLIDRVRPLVFVASLALVAVACGSDPPTPFEQHEVEAAVRGTLEDSLPVDPADLTCGDLPPRGETGGTDCRVTFADVDETLDLDVTSDGSGHLEVERRQAVLLLDDVTDAIDGELELDNEGPFTISCESDDIVVAAPDSTIDCTVRDEDHERTVVVTVLDTAGSLQARIEPRQAVP